MSGVLFVVYIPSKTTEERVRGKYSHAEVVSTEIEKGGYGDNNGAVGLDQTPLTTPEMQHRDVASKSHVSSFPCLFTTQAILTLIKALAQSQQ